MAFQIDPLVVVAILGLVNFVKALGLSGKVLTVASMVIGVLIAISVQLLPPDVVKIVIVGLLSGLGACGFYDFGSMIAPKQQTSDLNTLQPMARKS